MTITVSTFSDNGPIDIFTTASVGGAIFNSDGRMTVSSSTFDDNSANDLGGAIVSDGTMTVSGCTFSGNSAGTDGSGIANLGTLDVAASTFSDNLGGHGGGIHNGAVGTATITDSSFSRNDVNSGGGIYNEGTLAVTNSTFSDNEVSFGGGIWNNGTVTIANSTISGNTAFDGGGILNSGGGTMNASFVTIASNGADTVGGGISNASLSTFNIKNSIVGNSTSGGDCSASGGTFNAVGTNFDTDGTCAALDSDFMQATSAQLNLGPLQVNAPGTTATRALLAASVAIDAVSDCTLLDGTTAVTADQRGVSRPQGPRCDVGAYEAQVGTPTATPTETPHTPTGTPTDTPTGTPTRTPTNTPINTTTSTSTRTLTHTRTPTSTSTPTDTPTPRGPMILSGADEGSSRVFGSGAPNLPDTCIVVCEAGLNMTGCQVDDMEIGRGGTDGSGNFRDGGDPGIAVVPPLAAGDRICAVDVCSDPPRDGNCVLVTAPAPAPAMSPRGLMGAVALLSLVAMVGVMRLRRTHP